MGKLVDDIAKKLSEEDEDADRLDSTSTTLHAFEIDPSQVEVDV